MKPSVRQEKATATAAVAHSAAAMEDDVQPRKSNHRQSKPPEVSPGSKRRRPQGEPRPSQEHPSEASRSRRYTTRSTTGSLRSRSVIAANSLAPEFESSKAATSNDNLHSVNVKTSSSSRHPPPVGAASQSPCKAGGRQGPTLAPLNGDSGRLIINGQQEAVTTAAECDPLMPVAAEAASAVARSGSDNATASSPPAEQPEVPPATALAAGVVTSEGGSCGGGRSRIRSRLSIGKHRRGPSPPLRTGVNASWVDLGGRNQHHPTTHGSPWSSSSQRRPRPPFRAPDDDCPPGEHSSSCVVGHSVSGVSSLAAGLRMQSDNSVNNDWVVRTLGSTTPRHSPPPPLLPPPPFVGLENLGDTCYVNAVVQALVAVQALAACDETMVSARGGYGALDGGERAVRRPATGGGSGCSVAPFVGDQEGVPLEGSAAVAAAIAASRRASARADEEPILDVLETLLGEMRERNRALSDLESGGTLPQVRTPQAGAPQAVTPLAVVGNCTTRSGNLGISGAAVDSGAALVPGADHPDEAPTTCTAHTPRNGSLCAQAISPTSFVELVREGWQSTERAVQGVRAGSMRHPRERAGTTASANFGNGQQCVSELLGKLLDLGAPGVLGEGEASSADGSVGRDVDRLAGAFRGALCARTLCVECERDRVSSEEFTELTLPPFREQSPPPSPNRSTGAASAVNSHYPPELRTLANLVDTMLGSETLSGTNKVWCEACRQWTEAERRSSLHSPPRVLALHVRPATGGKSLCPLSTRTTPKPLEWDGHGAGVGTPGRGACKAGRGTADWSTAGAFIERVLVVKGAVRCQFHEKIGAAAAVAPAAPAGSSSRAHPDDACYDLVGIILHQGQTVESGHYTFARHVGARRPPRDQRSHDRPHDPSCAPGVSTGESENVTGEEGADTGILVSALAKEDAGGSAGCDRVREKDTTTALRNAEPSFVLFDDAHVRWLSSEEERGVLGGGGLEGGFGDAFLVFYARRHNDERS